MFKPSIYQENIFEWLKSSKGNCVVKAVPGSGKTTTLEKSVEHLPNNDNLFLAFNKHIVEELSRRLPNTKCSTIHSLGFGAIKKRFPQCKLKNNKYNQLIRQYLTYTQIDKKDESVIYYNLTDLIRFSQLNLIDYQNPIEFRDLVNHYGLDIDDQDFNYFFALKAILEEGIGISSQEISFDDMVWLPNILELPLRGYKWLLVDESQDLNKAQLSLVKRAFKRGTRALFVGDENQSIMAFAGADSQSIQNIIKLTKASQLPLSISYRLPLSHVELANDVYNVIEAASNAIDGKILTIEDSELFAYVEQGDLIICRCCAPLFQTYYSLLRNGIPAQIKNLDSARLLIRIIEIVFPEDYDNNYTVKEFNDNLDYYFQSERNRLLNKKADQSLAIANLKDKIDTIKAIYLGNKCKDVQGCLDAINRLSRDTGGNPVLLTTIHGAKGLESENVFILKPNLLPHPLAKKPWEKEQERNIKFVAFTRAKANLYFVKSSNDEDE